MRRKRRISDQAVEQVLSGHAPDPDLDGLAALIRSAKDAYVEPVSSELETRHLAAIAEAVGEMGAPSSRYAYEGGRRKMLTLAGKFAAAGLAAMLGMSGLAYAGVPLVPNPVKAVVDVVSDGEDTEAEGAETEGEGDLPAGAQEGRATAEAKAEAAKAYADAVRVWTACVAEKAPMHEESGAEGEFDPEAACGPKPNPSDEEFSPLTEPPAEQGQAGRELGQQMRQQHQPSEPDDGGEDEGSGSSSAPDHPTGPPEGTPGGPPQGAPGP